MEMKYNINKIHSDLVVSFDNVQIAEKSSHKFGNYFEIIVSEGNTDVKMILPMSSLENDTFNWKYYANPLKENSDLVDRTSHITNIYEHISDIISHKRFNKEYLEAIKNDNTNA